jgi:flagellum-specific peptidoglycan hydrolase FlgJ
MVPAAQTTARLWKVPASVTLAQCILESAWGTSQLATRARNYFGIKAKTGEPYIEFSTREVVTGRSVMEQANFARYGSAVDCFAAHAHLISSTPRYAPAMACFRDVYEFANRLQHCGYSTEPTYGDRLGELIRAYNLQQYDVPPPDQPAAAKEAV